MIILLQSNNQSVNSQSFFSNFRLISQSSHGQYFLIEQKPKKDKASEGNQLPVILPL